jgi:hypothetical protein
VRGSAPRVARFRAALLDEAALMAGFLGRSESRVNEPAR